MDSCSPAEMLLVNILPLASSVRASDLLSFTLVLIHICFFRFISAERRHTQVNVLLRSVVSVFTFKIAFRGELGPGVKVSENLFLNRMSAFSTSSTSNGDMASAASPGGFPHNTSQMADVSKTNKGSSSVSTDLFYGSFDSNRIYHVFFLDGALWDFV